MPKAWGASAASRTSEMVITFRPIAPNRLLVRPQPDKGVKLWLMIEDAGPGCMLLQHVPLDMSFAGVFAGRNPDADVRLLLDAVRGNQDLFMRRHAVKAAWRRMDPILDARAAGHDAPKPYAAGSRAPSTAVALIDRDGGTWVETGAEKLGGGRSMTAPRSSATNTPAPARAVRLREFSDSAMLAQGLAAHVADAIAARLATGGGAAIAVSGGRTPMRFFEALSRRPLDWEKVSVTLADERWVPETSERSNARLLRTHLLKGAAASARFVPLVTEAATPEAGRGEVEARIAALTRPFAAVVLGMGEDGHTASLFPGGDCLTAALAPAGGRLVEAISAPGAGEPRITLTLPALVAADTVALHIEGAAKRRVLETALAAGPVEDMPIRAVLEQSGKPVTVFWCP